MTLRRTPIDCATHLVLTASLALGALLVQGCSSGASRAPISVITVMRSSEDVEVLLDRAPTAPHVVTSELFAKSSSDAQSIALMRERAAALGLDGIYWINCTSRCSGRCSAKGFVYLDRTPVAMPASLVIAKE